MTFPAEPATLTPDGAANAAVAWPPGCDLHGCEHHYPPGRNLAAEGACAPRGSTVAAGT